MQFPSLSLIISGAFLGYIAYSIYTISSLFSLPPCENQSYCFRSYLTAKPNLNLYLFTSVNKRPINKEVSLIHSSNQFDYSKEQDIPIPLEIPRKTRHNGTLYLHIILSNKRSQSYNELHMDQHSVQAQTLIKLSEYAVPKAAAFNLLGEERPDGKIKKNWTRTISHLRSRVTFTIMTDNIKIPVDNLPPELMNLVKISKGVYWPIVNYDFLQTRTSNLVPIFEENRSMNITVSYAPISMGKLRLVLHIEAAMLRMKTLGFADKDIDEVKSIFADTNLYLLGVTFFIAAMHLCFDFLAFKNDINFWRKRNNLAGLSVQTVVWRAFNQTVIFLYLLDEGSSLLVLVPAGIGTIIEMWKSKKILRVELVRGNGFLPRLKFNRDKGSTAETRTQEFDSESMQYLKYLLYPLIVAGAVYSLLYQPHKSWYSWCINSLVNGVYAFGFLFMLPQLFVNYKMKSVAHLPWKAFMYKAFNTFIDDIFAFIITMPTAHRVACFRDDAIFLVYLYQRWLYPVDKSRIDSLSMDEDPISTKKTN